MRRRILSFIGALLVLMALAPVAQACSCYRGDPRTQLERSDGAFIGRLESVDPAPPNAMSTTYHFKVDEVFKGDIGDTVDVESSTSGASCGYEVERGQEMGFFLERDGGVWRGGLCGQIDPDELRKAAKPLPKPTGTGPLTFLVGGVLGDVRTVGLAADGKTLRYGEGDGKTTHMSVCPGSTAAAEIVFVDGPRSYLTVRNLDTFEVMRKTRITAFDQPGEGRYLLGSAVACRSRSGDDVVVFGSNAHSVEDVVARIVRITPGAQTELWEGKGVTASLPASGTKACVATDTQKLVEVDLSTRAVRDVAKIPHPSMDAVLSRSPGGSRVASLGHGYPDTEVYVVDVGNGNVKSTKMPYGGSGQAVWVSNDRLVVTGGGEDGLGVTIYDASLEKLDSWTGWTAGYRTIAVGDKLYGTSWGKLVTAPALAGPMKELRTLDGPELEAITAVPPRTEEPPAAPRTTTQPTASATTQPTTGPTSEPTPSPEGFAAPTSEPAANTGSPVIPAAALGVSALALGSAAFVWRRRSV